MTSRAPLGLVNADAHVDAVCAYPGGLALFRGDGNLGFAPAVALTTTAPAPLLGGPDAALADLNLDGALDFVYATNDGRIALFGGDGLGGFTQLPLLTTAQGSARVRVADLNGDGLLDLIGATQNGFLSVRLNAGAFQFGVPIVNPITVAIPLWKAPGLRVADLNGDGNPDLIATYPVNDTSTALYTALGNGSGAFTIHAASSFAAFDQTALAVADFDGDGKLDVATSGPASPTVVRVFPGDGAGGLGAPIQSVGHADDFEALDLDGDGDADLVGAGTSQEVVLLRGLGNGAFEAMQWFEAGPAAHAVALGHLDADANLDVVTSGNGSVTVLRGQAGGFVSNFVYALGASQSGGALGDVDQDGFADVLTGTSFGVGLRLLPGLGGGAFGAPVAYRSGSHPLTVGLADLDGDGRTDLVCTENWGNAVGVQYAGAGGTTTLVEYPCGTSPRGLALADFDTDGRLDVVVTLATQQKVALLRGTPTGALTPAENFAAGGFAISVSAGDVDQDGVADVVGALGPGGLSVLTSSAVGPAFDPPHVIPTTSGTSMDTIAIADVDSDSVADLITGGLVCQRLFGVGGGSFGTATVLAPGFAFRPALSDLDGDGHQDIAALDGYDTLRVLRGDGSGSFAPPLNYGCGAGGVALLIGDLDADGRPDAVVSKDQSETVDVLMQRAPSFPGASAFGAGTGGCAGTLGLAVASAPQVGNGGFALLATNAPPASVGLVYLGQAADPAGTDWLGIGLVFHLSPAGAVFGPVPIASDVGGSAHLALPIQPDPLLAGLQLYAQSYWRWSTLGACDPTASGWSSSRGLALLIQP